MRKRYKLYRIAPNNNKDLGEEKNKARIIDFTGKLKNSGYDYDLLTYIYDFHYLDEAVTSAHSMMVICKNRYTIYDSELNHYIDVTDDVINTVISFMSENKD